ncbi:TPA: hypothetical protein ACYEOD_002623 [Klebsiella michiganensis]
MTRKLTIEQAKRLRNDFECWQQDYDPKDDKEQYDMFGRGVVAMDMLIAGMYQYPVAYAVSNDFWNQGNHKQHIDGKQCDLFFPDDVSHGEKFEPDDYDYVFPLYRHAQPALEYPEVLPCPVLLEPGMRFGKGVKIRLVLEAIQRRAEHCAELEAMTPDERAEYDANIEAFKAMLPQPAPLVPDGYVMVPKEPTEAMMLHNSGCQHHAWDDPDCAMRQTRRLIWSHMLAAAPQEMKGE